MLIGQIILLIMIDKQNIKMPCPKINKNKIIDFFCMCNSFHKNMK